MRGLLYSATFDALGSVIVILFFVLFCGLVWSVYRRASQGEMNRASFLPLDDE